MIFLEGCHQMTKVVEVRWIRPINTTMVKLNTYGSALDNLGKIGAGGGVTDH